MFHTELVSFHDKRAIQALQDGEVIAFPTETVYGLACRYDSKEAFDKLVAIKKRPPDKPFTLMGGDNFNFNDFAIPDEKAWKVISTFVPGPITLLLKPKKDLPHHVHLNSPSIGIRISNSPSLKKFISEVGVPLLVPSANLSGQPPLINAKSVLAQFNTQLPYIIDDVCQGGLPSTIVDLSTKGEIKLIRQGELSFERIKEVYEGE